MMLKKIAVDPCLVHYPAVSPLTLTQCTAQQGYISPLTLAQYTMYPAVPISPLTLTCAAGLYIAVDPCLVRAVRNSKKRGQRRFFLTSLTVQAVCNDFNYQSPPTDDIFWRHKNLVKWFMCMHSVLKNYDNLLIFNVFRHAQHSRSSPSHLCSMHITSSKDTF